MAKTHISFNLNGQGIGSELAAYLDDDSPRHLEAGTRGRLPFSSASLLFWGGSGTVAAGCRTSCQCVAAIGNS